MWPFKQKVDSRPPSAAALAVAESLAKEPHRWNLGTRCYLLVHDSGVAIDTEDNFIHQPWFVDEPDANGEAVQVWIVESVSRQEREDHAPPDKLGTVA